MKENEDLFLDTFDYQNKRVVFTMRKWEIKSNTHAYLKLPQYKKFIEKAVSDPTEVWQDFDNPKAKRCQYYKYSATRYVKVVVWVKSKPLEVVTVYDLDYIKETNYPNLRRIYEKS